MTGEAIPASWDDVRANVPCQGACPALVRVPAYLRALASGDGRRATGINEEDVLLPGVLGRICARPCEDVCRHGCEGRGEPVAICHLKRAAADRAPVIGTRIEAAAPATGRRVAVVGAGPAGIAVARQLARFGHAVTVFDAGAEPGGLLATAIPAFRLPVEVRRREVAAALNATGITLRSGVRVGADVTLGGLREEHDAVVLCVGCGLSRALGAPGEGLPGVRDGLQFVTDAVAGAPPSVGDRVVVVGAGFTAVDCARIARRLGAGTVRMIYRRERQDAGAREEDLHETLDEGVEFDERLLPVAFIGEERDGEERDGETRLRAVRVVRTRIVVDAATGARRAEPIPESEHEVPADTAIVAIGQEVAPLDGIAWADVDRAIGRTALDGVFAAGDCALGAKSVVDAVGHGARVARAVDVWLVGHERVRVSVVERAAVLRGRDPAWDVVPRATMPTLEGARRVSAPGAEVETGFDDDAAAAEARRCYLCDELYRIRVADCVFCEKCVVVCPTAAISLTRGGRPDTGSLLPRVLRWAAPWRRHERGIELELERCVRCRRCVDVCPTDCIAMSRLDIVEEIDPRTGSVALTA